MSAPKGSQTRPTTDQFRETLFNILVHRFDHEFGAVLDLFSGSGALSIEAFSRGASSAVLIEEHPQTRKVLEKNLQDFELKDRCVVLSHGQIPKWAAELKKIGAPFTPFQTIFSDAPYEKRLTERAFKELSKNESLFASNALWIAETSNKESLVVPPLWQQVDLRTRGSTSLYFFQKAKHAGGMF